MKIETAEMRFLRPMAGYTLWDKKSSSDIREQFGIFNINDILTQYKINWREHIQRTDDNRLPKKILITNLKGEEIQEDHKRDREMISGRKEQAKVPKPYIS